ncbi:MAG: HNH endonuclease [Variovorax paradoxus]|uniref:HNH endonuclease n=1 Tax=Variovorax paradoxus TaxID=34073 RepID=A0A2W5QL32_VARPD|nr:MAG: HNH endonuclease [Variovorax paradoxus]
MGFLLRVREVLNYDPDTGAFTWRVNKSRARAGTSAGFRLANGYTGLSIDKQRVLAHRVALLMTTGRWPAGDVDHINGNRADNRIANLRDVKHAVNTQNLRTAHRDSSHGRLGVSRCGARFRAQIMVGGKKIHLGYHATPELASSAYLDAKRRIHAGCSI